MNVTLKVDDNNNFHENGEIKTISLSDEPYDNPNYISMTLLAGDKMIDVTLNIDEFYAAGVAFSALKSEKKENDR